MNSKKIFHITTILTAGIAIALTGTLIVTKVANLRETTTANYINTDIPQVSVSTTLPTSTTAPRETVPIGGNNVITTVTETKPLWKIEEEASISASIAESKAKTTTKKSQQKTTTKKSNSIVPQNRAAVISAFQKGINNLKKTKRFTLQEDKGLGITIDSITGGYLVQQTTERLIAQRANTPVTSYVFKDGADIDTGYSPKEIIPPMCEYLELDDRFVLSAVSRATADGGYTVTIKLKDEKESITTDAKHLHKVVPTIDLQEFFSEAAVIEDYELLYSGTTITALFDKSNRITYLEYYVPFKDAYGSGSLSMVPFTFSLHGEYVVKYDINY